MPKFVALIKWTDKGLAEAGDTVKRSEQVQHLAEQLGGRQELLLWTMGRYDLIGVYDMPDADTMAIMAIRVGKGGHIKTETLHAFTADEMGNVLGKLR